MFKLAAMLCVGGALASGCLATELSQDFSGIATQVAGDATGIFNIPANAPVSGTLTFNPALFTPDPVVPSGSSYLAVYSGGSDSVSLSFRDDGGTANVSAQSSFLELSSSSSVPWSLAFASDSLTFSLTLQSADPITLSPGTSPFDLAGLGSTGGSLSMLISNSSDSLGIDMSPATAVPEAPSSLLLGLAFAGVVIFRTRGFGERVTGDPGITHPKPVLKRL